MRRFLRVIDCINERLGRVICYLVLASTFLVAAETIMRYVFNAPTKWSLVISEIIMAMYYLLGGAYVLRHAGHTNLDILHNRLPIRTKAVVDLLTAMLFFFFCGVLLWKGSPLAWASLMMLETTGSPVYAPIYVAKVMLPIAVFLMLLQGVAKFIRDAFAAIFGRQYEY